LEDFELRMCILSSIIGPVFYLKSDLVAVEMDGNLFLACLQCTCRAFRLIHLRDRDISRLSDLRELDRAELEHCTLSRKCRTGSSPLWTNGSNEELGASSNDVSMSSVKGQNTLYAISNAGVPFNWSTWKYYVDDYFFKYIACGSVFHVFITRDPPNEY